MNTLRCFNKKMLVAATASVVLGMGVAGNASATSYAYSYNDVRNFSLTGPAHLHTESFDSRSHADLNGTVIADIDIGIAPPVNALRQNLGTAVGKMDNDFTPIGQTGYYGTGDAMIWSSDRATNVGESFLSSRGIGSGEGSNIWSAVLDIHNPNSVLTFKFEADPDMMVDTTGHTPWDFANAALEFSITIRDATGAPIFSWEPNGKPHDGIVGGDDFLDDIDLNVNLSAHHLAHHDEHSFDGLIYGLFGANTNPLNAGLYTLNVSMREAVNTSVPEPGTMFLLGGGLAGLAFAARRRAAAKA